MAVVVLHKIHEIENVTEFGSALDGYSPLYDGVDAEQLALWVQFERVVHELMHARLLGIRIFGDLEKRVTVRTSLLLDDDSKREAWQNEAQTVAGCIRLLSDSPMAKSYPALAVSYALPLGRYPSERTFRRMMARNTEQTSAAVDFCRRWLLRRKFIRIEGSK